MIVKFTKESELRNFLRDMKESCSSNEEFEDKVKEYASKNEIRVLDVDEPYNAADLMDLN